MGKYVKISSVAGLVGSAVVTYICGVCGTNNQSVPISELVHYHNCEKCSQAHRLRIVASARTM